MAETALSAESESASNTTGHLCSALQIVIARWDFEFYVCHSDEPPRIAMAESTISKNVDAERCDPEKLLNRIAELQKQIETAEQDREVQNAVFRIADITSSAEDMSEFYASLHDIVKELTSTDALFIAIYHEKENCLSYPYYQDQYDDEQEQESTPLHNRGLIPVEQLSHSLTWRVLSNNEVLRVVDVANSGLTSFGKTAQDWLGIPLRRKGKPAGVVCIQSYQPGFRYSDTEVEMMVFMAQHIGTALQRRRDASSLRQAHNNLKATAIELEEANQALTQQIAERELINKQMIALSHQAGKAEVATGVLHNVGNVLNSINVSANLVRESQMQLRLPSLRKTVELINAQDDLGKFFVEDQRGKAVPEFLAGLVARMEEEQSQALEEIQKLTQHVEHVKVIVAMQQSFAGISGLKETVCLNTLVNEAQVLLSDSIRRHEIDLSLEFDDLPNVMLERQRILQVIVNLLKNAKDSLTAGRDHDRKLTVRARRDEDWLCIEVEDNGCGIDENDLTKIFSHGFTTKNDGHGFGLHSCANTIGEMGGKLSVESEGLGRGATFSIVLPFIDANNTRKKVSAPNEPGNSQDTCRR